MGAIIVGGLLLIIIVGTTVFSCKFCKCCAKCRDGSCKEKCKRKPKEVGEDGEAIGDAEAPAADEALPVEDLDFYAPKVTRARSGRRGANSSPGGGDDGGVTASPPGSPRRNTTRRR